MVILYLVLVEVGKLIFYRQLPVGKPIASSLPHMRAHHRASR
jgi:hypothetical protein